MASQRVPPLLAVEIERAGTSANPTRLAPADRRDGCSQSDVGRGTDCCGAPRQARDSRVAANGQALYASEDDARLKDWVAGVEHVRSESRALRAGVRLLRR